LEVAGDGAVLGLGKFEVGENGLGASVDAAVGLEADVGGVVEGDAAGFVGRAGQSGQFEGADVGADPAGGLGVERNASDGGELGEELALLVGCRRGGRRDLRAVEECGGVADRARGAAAALLRRERDFPGVDDGREADGAVPVGGAVGEVADVGVEAGEGDDERGRRVSSR
jgi:hypothetical protein